MNLRNNTDNKLASDPTPVQDVIETNAEICGRESEVREIFEFITTKLDSKSSAILYLTGQPGTGKTMSINYVLTELKDRPMTRLNINCMRAQSSKSILTKICHAVKLEKFQRCTESEMVSRLTKKFSGRTSVPHLIVLDEIDQLPKSKNIDLIRNIFSWPNLPHSKLVLVGIANTVNLTSKYQTISTILGRDTYEHMKKIIFRPYTSKDIKAILRWYLENDENYEDAVVEQSALDMISARFARESGDIRGALNALKSVIDDAVGRGRDMEQQLIDKSIAKQQDDEPLDESVGHYPTPPSTPHHQTHTPCREKTNIASVYNSIKKRERKSHYMDDAFPFPHQIILMCICKLAQGPSKGMIEARQCKELVNRVMEAFGLSSSLDDYRAMLDNLELQGLISIKKGRPRDKIVLKTTESELNNLVQRKDMIMNRINVIA